MHPPHARSCLFRRSAMTNASHAVNQVVIDVSMVYMSYLLKALNHTEANFFACAKIVYLYQTSCFLHFSSHPNVQKNYPPYDMFVGEDPLLRKYVMCREAIH